MAKRRSGPPLYELIHSRPHPGDRSAHARMAVESAPTPDAAAAPASTPPGRVAPGRMMAIPAGYLFVACAVGLALVAGAFVIGYRTAENAVRAEFEEAWLSRVEGMDGQRPNDPLMAIAPGTITDADRDGAAAPIRPAADRSGEMHVRSGPGGPGWGDVHSDPRQRGYMYFVLMETRVAGAERLANFLRDEGLEAYVVPIDGKKTVRVIVLPALTTSSQQDPAVAGLSRQIQQAGLRWKLSGGHDNLSGAYIRTY